ncbi:MAG: gamma-glutamylcyclotransferase [Cyanobacteria bacterium P01_D01_bin.44]
MALTRATLTTGHLQRIVQQVPELEAYILSKTELECSIQQTLQQRPTPEYPDHTSVWIFAYGSLIWNPILQYGERRTGKIYGWHRRFCMRTPAGRGTPDRPGLTLALERGGSCCGVAYCIATEQLSSELLLLWQREMVVDSYIPRWVKVWADGQAIDAIAFTINPQHPLYAPKLSIIEMAASISRAQGALGSCTEYLLQTIAGLANNGITDRGLLKVRDRIKDMQINTGG